jgi:integrase
MIGPGIATLADVIDRAGQDDTLSPSQRAQIQSAVRVFCRAVRHDPASLPAGIQPLRPLLHGFHPVQAALAERRWQNIRSLPRTAIVRYGVSDGRVHRLTPMTPEWTELFTLLPSWGARAGLSHFLRFCSGLGVGPQGVDDAVSAQYLHTLEALVLKSNPAVAHQQVCRGWNRAVRTVPTWPRQELSVPRYRQGYVLPDTAFAPSLIAEIEAWCARLRGQDPVAEDLPPRPVKPSTADRRGFQLRQLASALVHRGRDPDTLRSLQDLAEIETLREGLRFFLERAGGNSTKQIFELGLAVLAVARHWIRLPEDEVQPLKRLVHRLAVPQRGMTETNRTLLRQFEDRAALAALFRYGASQFAEAGRRDHGEIKWARRAAIALATEFLIWCPVRISNLVGIHLDRHICRGRSRDGLVHLAIPPSEVKNLEPLEFVLPVHLARMLNEYVRHFHPRLARNGSRYLFPGKHGHASRHVLGNAISRSLFAVTGLRMNPHAFRHLSAMLYLRENPGGFEVVRRTLAHRDPQTTINAYMGFESRAATRHFDETILRLRRRTLEGTL